MPVPIQVAIRAVLKRDYLGSKKVWAVKRCQERMTLSCSNVFQVHCL